MRRKPAFVDVKTDKSLEAFPVKNTLVSAMQTVKHADLSDRERMDMLLTTALYHAEKHGQHDATPDSLDVFEKMAKLATGIYLALDKTGYNDNVESETDSTFDRQLEIMKGILRVADANNIEAT